MPDIISVIIALVLVIVAAVHDLREFRIPNRLMVVSLITGIFTGIVELFLKKTREVSMGSNGIKAHGFHYAVGVLAGYVVVLVYRCVVVL